MFLIARGPRQLAIWDGTDGERQGVRGKFERLNYVFAEGMAA